MRPQRGAGAVDEDRALEARVLHRVARRARAVVLPEGEREAPAVVAGELADDRIALLVSAIGFVDAPLTHPMPLGLAVELDLAARERGADVVPDAGMLELDDAGEAVAH